jgi:hypothetical protein
MGQGYPQEVHKTSSRSVSRIHQGRILAAVPFALPLAPTIPRLATPSSDDCQDTTPPQLEAVNFSPGTIDVSTTSPQVVFIIGGD